MSLAEMASWSFLSTSAVKADVIKASSGLVYAVEFFNVGSSPVYVRLYNMATTPGTGDAASIVWRAVVPGGTTGAGVVVRWTTGKAFTAGIGIRVTAAIADDDATALTASQVLGNVEYGVSGAF